MEEEVYLKRFGAHTIAKFLACMFITEQIPAREIKCLIKSHGDSALVVSTEADLMTSKRHLGNTESQNDPGWKGPQGS